MKKLSYLLLFLLSLNLVQNALCLCEIHDYQHSKIKYQLEPRKKLLSLISKEYYITTSMSLQILCVQTSLWLIPLADLLLDTDESLLLIYCMEATFTTMTLLVLFRLKIRYPQEPVKQSQEGSVLNNGFRSTRVLRYLRCILKTVLWSLINSIWTVTSNIKRNISLELQHSITTQDHKDKFKLSCICQ